MNNQVEQVAKEYAERVCNGQFPITYSREQVVNHTATDFQAGWKACQSSLPSLPIQGDTSIDGVKSGIDKDLAVEVAARFANITGKSYTKGLLKKYFVDGALWMRKRLSTPPTPQGSAVWVKASDKPTKPDEYCIKYTDEHGQFNYAGDRFDGEKFVTFGKLVKFWLDKSPSVNPVGVSAEKILDKIFYKPENMDWYKPVLKAMEEYKNQSE